MGDLAVDVGQLQVKVNNLEDWQRSQNGALRRLERKVDKVGGRLLAVAGGIIVALALLVVQLVAGVR